MKKYDQYKACYIYRHVRLDTNTTFYIGKGSQGRAWNRSRRNEYWKRIAKKHDYKVEILFEGLDEDVAFEKEIELIKEYRERGECEANMTDGGEGASGFHLSEEAREKLSMAHKGKKLTEEHKKKISENHGRSMLGKTHTKEARHKISEARKRIHKTEHPMYNKTHSKESRDKMALNSGGKPFIVYIQETGEFVGEWVNQSQCARDLNLNSKNVSACLQPNSKRKSAGGFTFERI